MTGHNRQMTLSERNPSLEQMKERGWAWVATNGRGKYGAPHTDDKYAADQVARYHHDEEELEPVAGVNQLGQELRIISWE